MKTPHQQRVEQFMRKAGQSVPASPTMPDEATRLTRAKLILEEALETVEGLGITAYSQDGWPITFKSLTLMPNLKPSLKEIADGCADLSVVSIGTLSACGIQDQPLLELVDQNNLAKFGPGGYRDENGKWRKPPNHQPPDIAGELDRQSKL